MSALLPLAQAQARLLELAERLPVETLPVEQSAGRYLAEPLTARRTQPAADMSAMDGYAIRFADRDGPWRVIGECQAGAPPCAAIGPGEAARIFTGALLPAGADSVLIQENVERDGNAIHLTGEAVAQPGKNVRPAGSDFREGDRLLDEGTLLTPAAVGLAVTAGHAELPVRRRARIAILSTGDELRAPGEACAPHQIPASSGPMVAAMLAGLPCEIALAQRLPDDIGIIRSAIDEARDCDIIVTIGGASVGDHDLVQPALEQVGADLDFWKVAIRPGKPVFAGALDKAIVLGLPGNPVSAFVIATLFLQPLVRHLCGAATPLPQLLSAPLAEPLPANGPREHYLRARLKEGRLFPLSSQDSAHLSGLAKADALIRQAVDAPAASAGAIAEYIALV